MRRRRNKYKAFLFFVLKTLSTAAGGGAGAVMETKIKQCSFFHSRLWTVEKWELGCASVGFFPLHFLSICLKFQVSFRSLVKRYGETWKGSLLQFSSASPRQAACARFSAVCIRHRPIISMYEREIAAAILKVRFSPTPYSCSVTQSQRRDAPVVSELFLYMTSGYIVSVALAVEHLLRSSHLPAMHGAIKGDLGTLTKARDCYCGLWVMPCHSINSP